MGELLSMRQRVREAPASKAKIQFCAHATVIITTEAGTRIIIDPWLKGNPRCPAELHDPGPIDHIVITHGHSDHCGSALDLAKKYKAKIYAAFELGQLLIKDGVSSDQVQPMNKGGTVLIPESGGLMVSLTHAYHSSSYTASDGQTYYAGEPCGAVITLESGRNIYHTGDTSLFGDMRLISELFEPEVLLLPIGDRFTMGPKQAAKAVQLLKPEYVIPLHYDTFEILPGKPEFLRTFLGESTAELVVLAPGEEFEF